MASVGANVDNRSKSTNNIANAIRSGGSMSLPLAIPVRRNRPPPAPQVFVPMPVKPGPNAYPLTGYKSPDDVQTILNQPKAVLLDGAPEMSAYEPPSVTEPPRETGPGNWNPGDTPTPAPDAQAQAQAQQPPQLSAEALAALSGGGGGPVPFWKNPAYVAPFVAVVVVVIAYVVISHFSKPAVVAPSPAFAPPPTAPLVRAPPVSYGDASTVWSAK